MFDTCCTPLLTLNIFYNYNWFPYFSDSAAKPDILSWIDGSLVAAGNYTHWDLNYPKLTKNRTDCGIFQAGRFITNIIFHDYFAYELKPQVLQFVNEI